MARPADSKRSPADSGSLWSPTSIYIFLVALSVLAVPLGAFWGAMVTFREAGLLGILPLAVGIVVLVAAYYVIERLATESPLLRRVLPGPGRAA